MNYICERRENEMPTGSFVAHTGFKSISCDGVICKATSMWMWGFSGGPNKAICVCLCTSRCIMFEYVNVYLSIKHHGKVFSMGL